MIDNIILLITGTLHQRPITELVPKCHPLGSFEEMASINIASTPAELYNAVMIDTPLGWSKHCYFTIKLHFLWQVFPFQWRLAPVKAALNTRPQLFNHWIVLSIRYITNAIGFPNTYPLERYPMIEQPRARCLSHISIFYILLKVYFHLLWTHCYVTMWCRFL